MANELARISPIANLKPMGISSSTGLTIYASNQFRPDGFCYQVGARALEGDMEVIEGIAEGTGCTLLCGIRVQKKSTGELICDIQVPANTRYSRQVVVEMIHQQLTDMIAQQAAQEGFHYDRIAVEAQIAEILDKSYFRESRLLVMEWAYSVGILKKEDIA